MWPYQQKVKWDGLSEVKHAVAGVVSHVFCGFGSVILTEPHQFDLHNKLSPLSTMGCFAWTEEWYTLAETVVNTTVSRCCLLYVTRKPCTDGQECCNSALKTNTLSSAAAINQSDSSLSSNRHVRSLFQQHLDVVTVPRLSVSKTDVDSRSDVCRQSSRKRCGLLNEI